MDTETISINFNLESTNSRKYIGLIVLDTDETTERDFKMMSAGMDDLQYFTMRVKTVNPVTLDNLRNHGPQLAQASSLLLPDCNIDVIAYSCTSGTVAMGDEEVAAQIHAGSHKNVPVVTPITAAIQAFKTLGVTSISMLTPYLDPVNQAMRKFIEAAGVSVLNIRSFLIKSDVDIARIPISAIYQSAVETCSEDADALFISCTALRAAETVDKLESELQKPVLSSNQCMFWQAMCTVGFRYPITGFGILLRECQNVVSRK